MVYLAGGILILLTAWAGGALAEYISICRYTSDRLYVLAVADVLSGEPTSVRACVIREVRVVARSCVWFLPLRHREQILSLRD